MIGLGHDDIKRIKFCVLTIFLAAYRRKSDHVIRLVTCSRKWKWQQQRDVTDANLDEFTALLPFLFKDNGSNGFGYKRNTKVGKHERVFSYILSYIRRLRVI